jgi:hypothetical protein
VSIASARERLGLGGRTRQWLSIEDVQDLEEISDPTTLEDETATSWREWAGENRLLVISGSLLALLTLGFLVMQLRRFAPMALSNPWVRRGAVALLIAGWAYRKGRYRARGEIREQHRLDLNIGDRVVPLLGRHVQTSGEADLFVPIKGFRRAGHKPVPYRVDDLGPAMADLYSKHRVSGDDAAIIRLHPQYTRVEETDYGTVVSVDSDDLEADPQARVSTLTTTIPTHDDEQLVEMEQQLEELSEQLRHEKTMKEKFRGQRDGALDLADKPIDERVDAFLERHHAFLSAERSGHSRRRTADAESEDTAADDWRGTGLAAIGAGAGAGTSGNGRGSEDVLDDVEEEVTPDDD